IWPLRMDGRYGCVLIEAFPAAQLRQWRLLHTRYNGADHSAIQCRNQIHERLRTQRDLNMNYQHWNACLKSAHALDAVICPYAAADVANKNLQVEVAERSQTEGLIAVHN